MKLKKFFTLAAAIFAFTTFAFSQVEQTEVPMFGNTRGAVKNQMLMHNFKVVSGTVSTHKFAIKNEGATPLVITDIVIPEKVGVTVINKTVKTGETATLIVTVDPTFIDKGKFSKEIVVKTEQKEPGVTTNKEVTFTVTGFVK